jgi:hypothetical protein
MLEEMDFGKKMALLAGLTIGIAFFGLQAMFGFPILNSLRGGVTDEARVTIKDASSGICVVEASDGIPREISNCQYKKDDVLVVSYEQGRPNLKSHSLKK